MVMSLTPLSLGAKSLSDYLKLTYIRYKSVTLIMRAKFGSRN